MKDIIRENKWGVIIAIICLLIVAVIYFSITPKSSQHKINPDKETRIIYLPNNGNMDTMYTRDIFVIESGYIRFQERDTKKIVVLSGDYILEQ